MIQGCDTHKRCLHGCAVVQDTVCRLRRSPFGLAMGDQGLMAKREVKWKQIQGMEPAMVG